MVYSIPRIIDINARSKLIRGKNKLLIIGRCVEIEHRDLLKEFIKDNDYAVASVCPEEEHVNHVGFKIAGIIYRNNFKEIAVLTVDGSMHCTQLHWMLEEIFKFMNIQNNITRKHYVIYKNKIYSIPLEVVKYSRYLYKVANLLKSLKEKQG